MLDIPPSDPADHAEDFSRRYCDDLEILVGQAMMDLDIPKEKMGAEDHQRGSVDHCFYPGEREGGTVSPDGRVMLDSGLMNPDLLAGYDEATRELWKRTRIGDRAQAIIAHELAEHETGDHELALIAGPETDLPVSPAASELLKQMKKGWKRRSADHIPSRNRSRPSSAETPLRCLGRTSARGSSARLPPAHDKGAGSLR